MLAGLSLVVFWALCHFVHIADAWWDAYARSSICLVGGGTLNLYDPAQDVYGAPACLGSDDPCPFASVEIELQCVAPALVSGARELAFTIHAPCDDCVEDEGHRYASHIWISIAHMLQVPVQEFAVSTLLVSSSLRAEHPLEHFTIVMPNEAPLLSGNGRAVIPISSASRDLFVAFRLHTARLHDDSQGLAALRERNIWMLEYFTGIEEGLHLFEYAEQGAPNVRSMTWATAQFKVEGFDWNEQPHGPAPSPTPPPRHPSPPPTPRPTPRPPTAPPTPWPTRRRRTHTPAPTPWPTRRRRTHTPAPTPLANLLATPTPGPTTRPPTPAPTPPPTRAPTGPYHGCRCNHDTLGNNLCEPYCNTEECQWDGGDCSNVPPDEPLGEEHDFCRLREQQGDCPGNFAGDGGALLQNLGDCKDACRRTEGCNFYVWWTQGSTINCFFKRTCYTNNFVSGFYVYTMDEDHCDPAHDPSLYRCNCHASFLGDGVCDGYCNNAECNYDLGDCASATPSPTVLRGGTMTQPQHHASGPVVSNLHIESGTTGSWHLVATHPDQDQYDDSTTSGGVSGTTMVLLMLIVFAGCLLCAAFCSSVVMWRSSLEMRRRQAAMQPKMPPNLNTKNGTKVAWHDGTRGSRGGSSFFEKPTRNASKTSCDSGRSSPSWASCSTRDTAYVQHSCSSDNVFESSFTSTRSRSQDPTSSRGTRNFSFTSPKGASSTPTSPHHEYRRSSKSTPSSPENKSSANSTEGGGSGSGDRARQRAQSEPPPRTPSGPSAWSPPPQPDTSSQHTSPKGTPPPPPSGSVFSRWRSAKREQQSGPQASAAPPRPPPASATSSNSGTNNRTSSKSRNAPPSSTMGKPLRMDKVEKRSTNLIADMMKTLDDSRKKPLEERKRIFKELQRQLHPDKNMDTPEMAEAAKMAFQKLMEERAFYFKG